MKMVRYGLLGVGGLLLLLVIGAGIFVATFDANNYKDDIRKLVLEKTGRELTLAGDVKLSMYPGLMLQFGPATLSNASGFGTEPMLALDRVLLGVKWGPLLAKRVEVSRIELVRPQLHLMVDKNGKDNWSDIGPQSATVTPAGPGVTDEVALQVAGLRLTDGELSYSDAGEQSSISIRKLGVDTGALESGKPVELTTHFDLRLDESLSAATKLRATLNYNLKQNQFTLNAPAIEALLAGSSLPRQGVALRFGSRQIALDLDAQTLAIPEFRIEALGTALTGSLNGTTITDAPRLRGAVAMTEVSLRDLLGQLGITAPVTSDPNAFKRFSIRGDLDASGDSIGLSRLTMQLDDSTMTGSAAIASLSNKALRFDLAVNKLDASRYMEPDAAPAKGKPAAQSPPVALPVDLLRALNMKGDLRVAEASVGGIQLKALRVGVDAAKGRVHISPAEAGMYGGTYRGDIMIDATAVPQLRFNDQVNGVDFAALGRDWLKTNKISGKGNLAIKATATGKDSAELKRSLNGSLSFKVDNGALEGKDILYEIRRARALIRKEAVPERTGPERTAFSQLSATGAIANGVVTSNDIAAVTQAFRVNGKGTTNLVASVVDYSLDVSILKAAERDVPADLADSVGAVIPVRVTGALGDPTIRPDIGAMAKAAVKQKLDEKKQELEDQLREKLGDKLKGLFGK